MKPAKGILHREFRYANSAATDIRRLFARVRREMREQQERAGQPVAVVRPIKRGAK